MIKIEKGVPITSPARRVAKYPYPDMEVGDSFVVPLKQRSGAVSSARTWGERQEPERRFTSREIAGNKVRVWRVE